MWPCSDIDGRTFTATNRELMDKQALILLVDDDADIRELIHYHLAQEGYGVVEAEDGLDGLKQFIKHQPKLVLMDVMMPHMDGVEACKAIRARRDGQSVAIAFLSARGEDYSQLAGFEAGADDYITKPIQPKVLISRVKALLRRTAHKSKQAYSAIEVAGLRVDPDTFTVTLDGKSLALPRKEFELLYLLATKPGSVLTREVILQEVWGDDVIVGDRTIDVHIRRIRGKIGQAFITTIKGVGYKLTP